MNDLDAALRATYEARSRAPEPPALLDEVLAIPDLDTPHQRPWLPHIDTGEFSMFSALKFVVAGLIVALFGGFLLASILPAPQDGEVVPAAVTDSPSPSTVESATFPTGTFVAEEGDLTLEFGADGTCMRSGVPCTFGVNGDVYSEMTFEEPSGAQVPATYFWDFDGERLTFEPWEPDQRPTRQEVYADHTFRLVEAGEPLATTTDSTFPIGMLVEAGSRSHPRMIFREDGRYEAQSSGRAGIGDYVINGNLYTEMTSDWGRVADNVPATYRWNWDGERLTFSLWGEDQNGYRKSIYTGYVYVMDETSGLLGETRRLLLSHPQLDVWVTVEITPLDTGGYEAIATIDNEPLSEGVGDTVREAVKASLESLGEPYASEIAASVKG